MTRVLAGVVVGILIGFGSGYVVNDQVSGHTRTVIVQHKRDPSPRPSGSILDGPTGGSILSG